MPEAEAKARPVPAHLLAIGSSGQLARGLAENPGRASVRSRPGRVPPRHVRGPSGGAGHLPRPTPLRGRIWTQRPESQLLRKLSDMRNFPSTLQEFFCRKGKKKKQRKNLHPLASGRIFLLCEAGREENSRFLLLHLIDSNMKYSGVVLIRLWFSSKSRGKKEKRSSPGPEYF